jgi:hypothetical protein
MMALLPHELKLGLAVLFLALDRQKDRLSSLSDLTSVGPQNVLLMFYLKS